MRSRSVTLNLYFINPNTPFPHQQQRLENKWGKEMQSLWLSLYSLFVYTENWHDIFSIGCWLINSVIIDIYDSLTKFNIEDGSCIWYFGNDFWAYVEMAVITWRKRVHWRSKPKAKKASSLTLVSRIRTQASQEPSIPWWRHLMKTISASLAICAGNSPVISEFPSQRPVTRTFDVFFDLRLNKCLSKQS